uniref:Uncharacterized protein n=1 Tax=Phytophthora ramorum TaxID=164328 RepID=H3H5L6_PHYRM
MAPTGTSGPPASSAQTPSASPGDGSPSGGDVAGESPSVSSPTPPPVDDEEEEVEEELPEEEEAPDDAADESMDAPSGRSSAQTPSRLLLLDRALALQGESALPSGRDIPHDPVELLDQDQVLHTKFPLDPLLEMLVRMMFWNKLDETPWTKHVPRRYFRAARAKLDDLLEDDVRPPVWDALMSLDQEEDDLIPEVFEPEVDDKTKDGDFVPGEEFELPEDEVIPVDESPLKHTRQKAKRRRTSSSTSGSTPSKKPKRSKRRNDLSATDLARKDFESLTSLEKTIIETPGPSITSWMHLGIRVKRGDPTTLSALQTPGFPDYAPNRFDLDLLKERCDGQELGAFLNTMPWRKMFDERPRELYFHKREDLDDEVLNALDDWMDFVYQARSSS